MKAIVFIDRDGVLNRCGGSGEVPIPPRSLAELRLLPGVRRACRLLKDHGYGLVIVTNQPDVARGTQSREAVEEMNAWVAAALGIDDVMTCWHDDSHGCDCRKPKPGMLERAAAEARVDVRDCFMVGDRWRDIEAGRRAGCRSALVGDGYDEGVTVTPDYCGESLLEVARWITSLDDVLNGQGMEMGEVMTSSGNGIKLFADGADKPGMLEMYRHPEISGFTTNPTLMRKAGIEDYLGFARDILRTIRNKPISFEVFSDDFDTMEREARLLASLGRNVYVKVPVTNTEGLSSASVVRRLTSDGIRVNVTALMTLAQVETVAECLGGTPSCVSVFAGRIADTGRDPMPIMARAIEILSDVPNAELIWASPRELLNVVQAAEVGCHIITATNDIIKKLDLLGKDLTRFSLETVQMFHNDACAAGYELLGVEAEVLAIR